MKDEMRRFVGNHPDGWSHEDWRGFLEHLQGAGYDTSDEGKIGTDLERERLTHALESKEIPGLGPRRIQALVDRYGRIYELRHADADDIAQIRTMPRSLAEEVARAIR